VTGNTNYNALISSGTTQNGNTYFMRYVNDEQKFTFQTWASTYTRVYLYKQAQNYDVTTVVDPQDAGTVTYTAGVVVMDGQDKSQQFETVAFTVEPNEGYRLHEVTVIDASGAPVELTPMRGTGYSFVMPASDVLVTASFVDAATGVATVDAARTVQTVTYCDAQGRMSRTPMQGVNIVITRYTDGTVRTSKALF